ncbi:UNVERIFIED_CONTAM: hypothetical protein PYX00_008369 [Menopon gallinae]|uniref:Arsenite methyltransferase n=1 Tax=Menopon gallinae TaxID=328185 RepID=A0AAW2HNG6_9NEOP
MAVSNAQNKFMQMMSDLNEDDKLTFLKWIDANWNLDDLHDRNSKEERVLNCIAAELRPTLPLDAILPTETIVTPIVGPNADCDPKTTVHLDEFLYDDNYIDRLVDKGQISRHYCAKCYSKDVKLLTFISHSMSIKRIIYLFTSVLPPLSNKEVILDIGSRLGGVLYGAYLLTPASKIVGVELNNEFCKLQEKIVQKYNFKDRIEIVCSNIFNRIDLLSTADIIILNNVFEFFADVSECINAWHLLSQHIKVGCIIVTIPHLHDTFSRLEVGFDWTTWVEELPIYKDNEDNFQDWEHHQQQMKHYRVKQKIQA